MQKIILKEELTSPKGPLAHETIKDISPISGGCIHNAWHIELENGNSVFAKTSSKKNFAMLEFEAECLENLRRYTNNDLLTVPQPLAIQELPHSSILLMPWMVFSNSNQTNLGKGLALLHQNSSSEKNQKFGWAHEGFIGSGIQHGGWKRSWGKLFVELRLIPQLKKGATWGIKISKYHELLEKLVIFLDLHEPKPSLVHGDLWSGNAGTESSGKGIIFDPASYWADREVDIAMAQLFGGFSQDFYNGYNDIWPLSNSAEQRIGIYNLYHLLNHANIFGGHYQQQSLSEINKIALRFKS